MNQAARLCDDDGCENCRNVVIRTYRELRQSGSEDHPAFSAAVRVYSLRHPERSGEEVVPIVSEWISKVLER